MKFFKTEYGYFDENGDYVVTNPKTPMPWINVLTNGRYGTVWSQSGSGYSFFTDASQSLITRWVQDLVRDDYGRYFYIRDDDTGEIYSAAFQPVQKDGVYRIRFAPGKIVFDTEYEKFSVATAIVVPLGDDGELINIRLKNKTRENLNLSIFSYFELNMGTNADVHREFHKLFFETEYVDEKNALISRKHLWTAGPNHWNDSYPYVVVHSASEKVKSFETDKRAFLGMYGTLREPRAVKKGICENSEGRHVDGMCSLHVETGLEGLKEKSINFFVGIGANEKTALDLAVKYNAADFEEISKEVSGYWEGLLGGFKADVPDRDLGFLLNKWLPYQAVAGRLMARTAYYQMGGAYGFRDQLQDSLAALWLDPLLTERQILLHAAHQRRDGTVQHWWLPFSGASPEQRWSDDLLWLPFAVSEYVKHTGDFSVLGKKEPFADGGEATVKEHCVRSIRSVLSKRSPRGIPFILDGDWNDGLNGVGRRGKGESFWMSEFLYVVLKNAEKYFLPDESELEWLETASEEIREAFEKHAWNGGWFDRATSDDGRGLGGIEDGRIFLNAQTWAAISKITSPERRKAALEAVKSNLMTEYGPLLFSPPLTSPDENIGYLSRYSPGSRENGGIYTHAAVWTLWAAWNENDAGLAERSYETLSPIKRSQRDPDLYRAEPYVTPGNSEGPLSPESGKAGWTWYTGSAGWLYRSLIQYYIGINPSEDGISFSPCTKSRWKDAKFEFSIRRGRYFVEILNPKGRFLSEFREIRLDGEKTEGNLIPYLEGDHKVSVIY